MNPTTTPLVERRRRPRRTIGTTAGARNHSPYTAIAARLYHEAELLFGHKRYVESEAKVIQLLHLQERVIGRRHPDYALALSMLGEIRLIRSDFTAAERMLREALDIRRESQGESHPDFANVLGCLSRLYWRRGPREQAEPYLDRALKVRIDALGARHPETVRNRRELAGLRRRLGNW
ncbi:tetratricopeptide repeat protein, partial [Singulisphaera rosea]